MTKSSGFGVNSGLIAGNQGKFSNKTSGSGILKHKVQQSEYSHQMSGHGGDGSFTQEGLLSFDEIVLESNEIDLGYLQQQPNFVERRFP